MKYRRKEAKAYARDHLRGIWAATLTPFASDLRLDEAGWRRNLRHWYRELGIAGLFVNGKQGEFYAMTLEERKCTAEAAVAEKGGGVMVSCSDQSLDTVLELARHAQCVIVEGAGGFLVPLGRDFDTADLARALGLPAILVVGMRLGCLNHALLTRDAILARGTHLAGWVASHVDPDMRYADENVATLQSRMGAPLLARLGHDPNADPDAIAAALDAKLLQELSAPR